MGHAFVRVTALPEFLGWTQSIDRCNLFSIFFQMKLRHVYLGLSVIGLLLPYAQLVPWLLEHGFDFSLLCGQLFANRVSAFFGLDVIVSAVVLFVFIATERRRAAVPYIWLPVIGTLIIGVSFGLPLFLYLRQIRLDETPT